MPTSIEPLTCLRCPGVTLIPSLEESTDTITFLQCPSCHRPYKKRPGTPLTYRWLHPVTIALYWVIFEDEPVLRAESIAEDLVRGGPSDELLEMIEEIELELDQPTQPVRDALENRATEEKCREYLRALVSHVRARL